MKSSSTGCHLRVQAICGCSHHLRCAFRARTLAPLDPNMQTAATSPFSCIPAPLRLQGGRGRLWESLGTPAGWSTRLQTNLTESRRAAGAVRGPLCPEFPPSSRFLSVLTCLQASRLWQFNWCGESEAVRSRQGWPVFWKKETPPGGGSRTVADTSQSAVYGQVRVPGSGRRKNIFQFLSPWAGWTSVILLPFLVCFSAPPYH